MSEEKEQINKESELLILLDTISPNYRLYCGIKEKHVIIDVPCSRNYGLSRIMDCNHIHRVIEESGKNGMLPREIFNEFCYKGWLDDE